MPRGPNQGGPEEEKGERAFSLVALGFVTLLLLAAAAGVIHGVMQFVSERTHQVMWEVHLNVTQPPVRNGGDQ